MRVLFHFDASGPLVAALAARPPDGLDIDVIAESDVAGFAAALPDADILWHVLRPVTATDIARAPRLQLIQKLGVGVNTIDVAAAQARRIAVCNMPGVNSQAVAEMTLLLMLGCLRQWPALQRLAGSARSWEMSRDLQGAVGEMAGRTVGFVGFGGVPSRLAPVVAALGARVVYASRSAKAVAWERLQLDDLLAMADIVSLHLPLISETSLLLDAARIGRMRPGAILVNTARGGLVDEPALVAALESGRLGAAGLDVATVEPLPADHPLRRLPNVLLTPHVAWLTGETLRRAMDVALDNAHRLQRKAALLHQVA
jgi:phosphoglycerate dehydrogenase-like enzyme